MRVNCSCLGSIINCIITRIVNFVLLPFFDREWFIFTTQVSDATGTWSLQTVWSTVDGLSRYPIMVWRNSRSEQKVAKTPKTITKIWSFIAKVRKDYLVSWSAHDSCSWCHYSVSFCSRHDVHLFLKNFFGKHPKSCVIKQSAVTKERRKETSTLSEWFCTKCWVDQVHGETRICLLPRSLRESSPERMALNPFVQVLITFWVGVIPQS